MSLSSVSPISADIKKPLGAVKVRTLGSIARFFMKHQVTYNFTKCPGILKVREVARLWDTEGGS